MPHKLLRMHRTGPLAAAGRRPVMLAIAGDSAAGKDDFMRLEPADFLASRVFNGLAGLVGHGRPCALGTGITLRR